MKASYVKKGFVHTMSDYFSVNTVDTVEELLVHQEVLVSLNEVTNHFPKQLPKNVLKKCSLEMDPEKECLVVDEDRNLQWTSNFPFPAAVALNLGWTTEVYIPLHQMCLTDLLQLDLPNPIRMSSKLKLMKCTQDILKSFLTDYEGLNDELEEDERVLPTPCSSKDLVFDTQSRPRCDSVHRMRWTHPFRADPVCEICFGSIHCFNCYYMIDTQERKKSSYSWINRRNYDRSLKCKECKNECLVESCTKCGSPSCTCGCPKGCVCDGR